MDARIASYHGQHPVAFGAALRCLAEGRRPTPHDLDVCIAGLLAYEAAREKGMTPTRAEQEGSAAVGTANDSVIQGWWDKVLVVYERERSR